MYNERIMVEEMEKTNNAQNSLFQEGYLSLLYAAIIDNSNDAIIGKSIDGTIQTWNKASERIFGYTAEEAVGKHISILIPKERAGEEDLIISKIKRKEKVEHFETVRLTKAGQPIDISVTISPIIDEQGNVVGASKIVRDISGKKNIERTLAETVDRVSEQTSEILEVLLNYVIKDYSLKATVSDKGDELDAIAVGLNTLGEELQAAKEAEKHYVEQLHKLNAELERKVAERTSELAQYKYALDEAAIVEITDINGDIIHVNDNKLAVTRHNREELLGQNSRIVNSGYHSKEYIAELWDTITSGKIWKGEFRNKAKDGSLYWVNTTIVPFVDEEGKPYQYMAIKTDITENKKNEIERIERAYELEAVNKELESFSYSVSHDLRAPLRAIDGYALMLEEDYDKTLDSEAKRLIKVIRQNANYMGNLIDDLLNFSRLGRKEVKKATVNMDDLVKAIVNEIDKTEVHNAAIIIHPLHTVRADKAIMSNVWVNLISNAIKYSSKKEKPVVEISSEKGENEVIFCVKDNGAGFEMEYADKLFGVFQRLHSAEEFEGTGVGLATAQRIIHKHGGRIWAEAEVGQGATFYFTIPDKTDIIN